MSDIDDIIEVIGERIGNGVVNVMRAFLTVLYEVLVAMTVLTTFTIISWLTGVLFDVHTIASIELHVIATVTALIVYVIYRIKHC